MPLARDPVVALDPFDAAAHTGLGPARAAEARRDRRDARVPGGALDRRAPTRPPRTAISAKAICSAATAPTPSRKRSRRSRSRRASSGRRTCCSRPSRARVADMAKRALGVAGLALLGAALWPVRRRHSADCSASTCARRPAAQNACRSRPPLRRPAVDVRPRPLLRLDAPARRGATTSYDEPWYIDSPGRRMEPLAPRADRHVDPGPRSGRHPARGSRALEPPVDLHRRGRQPPPERDRGADPARVPAARRHADLRRLPRPDRVGQRRARAEARLPRSQDRRPAEGPSDLQLLLRVRVVSRRRRGWARSCRGGRGRRAATSPTCARSRTMPAARWCSSTGTSTWATAGNGRTHPSIRATSNTPRWPTGWRSTRSSTR